MYWTGSRLGITWFWSPSMVWIHWRHRTLVLKCPSNPPLYSERLGYERPAVAVRGWGHGWRLFWRRRRVEPRG